MVIGIGGNGDMIDHKSNGYLAKPFDTEDLALGIEWILNNSNYAQLRKNAREKVVNQYSFDIVSKKYISFYESIIGK